MADKRPRSTQHAVTRTEDTGGTSRRSVLKTIGASAVGVTALLPWTARATDTWQRESIRIDYDDYDEPADVYDISDVRSNQAPVFDADPTDADNRVLSTTFDGSQKTANIGYDFTDHMTTDEVYSRIMYHPNDVTIADSGTLRFYWAGVRSGSNNSGVNGAPTGNDGWTNALSIAHRGNHDHPDGYTLSLYTYHMDQPSTSGEVFRSDGVVAVDQWNEIECYQRLNSYQNGTANADGVFRLWLDGELVFEKDDFRWVSESGQEADYVGPVGYWYMSDQQGQTMYYDEHEIVLGGMPWVR